MVHPNTVTTFQNVVSFETYWDILDLLTSVAWCVLKRSWWHLGTHHLISGGGGVGAVAREFYEDFVVVMAHIWRKKVCHASPLREKWAPDSINSTFVGASHVFLQFYTTLTKLKLQNRKFKLNRRTFCEALFPHFHLFYFLTLTTNMVMTKKKFVLSTWSRWYNKYLCIKEKNCHRRSEQIVATSTP